MEYEINEEIFHYLTDEKEGPAGRFLQAKAEAVVGAMKGLIDASHGSHLYTTYIMTPSPYKRRPTMHPPEGSAARSLPHFSSDDGTPPADWTGALKDSIYATDAQQTRSDTGQFGGMSVFVVCDDDAVELLEHGTALMAPRPFMAAGLDIGMSTPVSE